jgi:ribosome-binding protein aMBF1 (putative translation factor)
MTDTPQLPPHLVFFTLYATFEALQQIAPTDERAAVLRRLAPLRHRVAHGREAGQLDGLDAATQELLDNIEASSLGSPHARALRALVAPDRVAKTIARRDGRPEIAVDVVVPHSTPASTVDQSPAKSPTSEAAVRPPRTGGMEFGAELRRLRQSRGMSLASLGQAVYFTKGYLSKVENGRARPNPVLVSRLRAVLDIPADLLAAAGFLDSSLASGADPHRTPPPPLT